MKKSSVAWLFPIAFLLGACVWLLRTGSFDARAHQSYEEHLKEAREVEERLDGAVLQTRIGLLTDYDPLVAATRERNRLLQSLAQWPSYVSVGQARLETLRDAIEANAREKTKIIEGYKSDHAVLRNSLAYFPKLIEEVRPRLESLPDGREIVVLLERLLQDALVFDLSTTREEGERLHADVEKLQSSLSAGKVIDLRPDLELVLAHAQVILDRKPKVDATLRRLAALPTSSIYASLQSGYDEVARRAIHRAEVYRLLAYASSLALLTLVAALVIRKLIDDARALRAAKGRVDAALEATSAAESKYRSIFENAGEGIFQTSSDGRYLSANPALARIYGYTSADELEDAVTSIGRQLYVDPERRRLFAEMLERQEQIFDFESAIRRKDGSIAWISETARAVRNAAGKLLYYEGLVTDINERRQNETERVQRHEREVRHQRELLGLAQMDKSELAVALREVIAATARTLNVKRVSAWRLLPYGSRGAVLELIDKVGPEAVEPTPAMDHLQLDGESGYLKALAAEPYLAIADAAGDPRSCELAECYLRPLKIVSTLDVPIQSEGELLAVLRLEELSGLPASEQRAAGEHAGGLRTWQPDEIDFAVAAANQIALCFETAERIRAEREAEHQRQRAEKLLLNILPGSIAERLKIGGGLIADHFPEATVLFADIVNFTQFSAERPPSELVSFLNRVFSAFDQLASQYGLEKIKTIGDAYMVVGGVPTPREDHTEAVVRLGIAMLHRCAELSRDEEVPFTMRIGVNCGPVVAGVIGIQKFIYDLWGDTVNLASRMESQGVTGQIQVTEEVYLKLRDRYAFISRGEIEIKGRGMQKAYIVKGALVAGNPKPE